MREIKLRGKRVDNGEWVYGDLIQSKPNRADGKHSSWIIEKTIMPFGAISTPTEKFIQVIPETVGDYTELKDKNGTEIYEGDIVQSEATFYDIHRTFKTVIKWDNDIENDSFGEPLTVGYCIIGHSLEVIGNIHENPNLLGGENV